MQMSADEVTAKMIEGLTVALSTPSDGKDHSLRTKREKKVEAEKRKLVMTYFERVCEEIKRNPIKTMAVLLKVFQSALAYAGSNWYTAPDLILEYAQYGFAKSALAVMGTDYAKAGFAGAAAVGLGPGLTLNAFEWAGLTTLEHFISPMLTKQQQKTLWTYYFGGKAAVQAQAAAQLAGTAVKTAASAGIKPAEQRNAFLRASQYVLSTLWTLTKLSAVFKLDSAMGDQLTRTANSYEAGGGAKPPGSTTRLRKPSAPREWYDPTPTLKEWAGEIPIAPEYVLGLQESMNDRDMRTFMTSLFDDDDVKDAAREHGVTALAVALAGTLGEFDFTPGGRIMYVGTKAGIHEVMKKIEAQSAAVWRTHVPPAFVAQKAENVDFERDDLTSVLFNRGDGGLKNWTEADAGRAGDWRRMTKMRLREILTHQREITQAQAYVEEYHDKFPTYDNHNYSAGSTDGGTQILAGLQSTADYFTGPSPVDAASWGHGFVNSSHPGMVKLASISDLFDGQGAGAQLASRDDIEEADFVAVDIVTLGSIKSIEPSDAVRTPHVTSLFKTLTADDTGIEDVTETEFKSIARELRTISITDKIDERRFTARLGKYTSGRNIVNVTVSPSDGYAKVTPLTELQPDAAFRILRAIRPVTEADPEVYADPPESEKYSKYQNRVYFFQACMYCLVWFVLNFWGASGDDVTAKVGVYTHRLQIENKDGSTPPIRIKGSASLIRAYNEVFQEYAAFPDNVSKNASSVFRAIEAAYPHGKETDTTKSMAGSRYLKQLLNVNLDENEPRDNGPVYMLRLRLAALGDNIPVHLAAAGTGRSLSVDETDRMSKTCSLAAHPGIKCANPEEILRNERGVLNHNACVFTPAQGLFAQAPDKTSGALYAHVQCVEQRFISEVETSRGQLGMQPALMTMVFGVTKSALSGRKTYTHRVTPKKALELTFEKLTSQLSSAFADNSGLTSEQKSQRLRDAHSLYRKLVHAVMAQEE